MTTKNKDKKDKKKLLVLALFLFAVIALGGYGVYSYFWTEGSFSGTSDSVSIASFDPNVSINGNSADFLGDGGDIILSCPSASTNETVECTGSVSISNNGGTDVVVGISDGTSGTYDSNNISASPSSPNFDWTEKTIEAGGSETLNITVPVSVSSDFGSDSAIERNSSYDGDKESYVYITVGFKLKATQVHD